MLVQGRVDGRRGMAGDGCVDGRGRLRTHEDGEGRLGTVGDAWGLRE